MGLFDKKYCDFCGNKIGLLGNKKLEDGNMCKDCAAKLSPWFSERRHSTKADITGQLNYREENKSAVAAFNTTRSLGKSSTKVLIDENQRKFMVTSAKNLADANPDVLDISQITDVQLDINESRNELKRKDAEGKQVSYNPPRYEYSYMFYVTIVVNHPYIDQMKFGLSNGYVHTGERQMGGFNGGWNMNSNSFNLRAGAGIQEYTECVNLGNEIKNTLLQMRSGSYGGQGFDAGQGYGGQQGNMQFNNSQGFGGNTQFTANQGGFGGQQQSFGAGNMQFAAAQGGYGGQQNYGNQQNFGGQQQGIGGNSQFTVNQGGYGGQQNIANQGYGQQQMQSSFTAAPARPAAPTQMECPWCGAKMTPENGHCPFCDGNV